MFMVSGLNIVLDLFSGWVSQPVLDVIASLSFLSRFESISRGVIDIRDIIYFVSLMLLWLYLTTQVVDRKKAQ